MYLIYLVPGIALLYLSVSTIRRRLAYREKEFLTRAHGCSPPTEHSSWNFIANFTLVPKLFIDPTGTYKWFQRYGRTFALPHPDVSIIITSHPENMRAVQADGKSWGVEATRLPVMEPFLGRCFMDTDGHEWSIGRKLLKPMFGKANIKDLSVLEKEVDQFLSKVTKAEGAINLQPLFHEVFLHTSLNFILGLDYSTYADKFPGPYTKEEFIKAFNGGIAGIQRQFILRGLHGLERFVPDRQFRKDCAIVHEHVDYFIDQALASSGEKTLDSEATSRQSLSLVSGVAKQTDDRYLIRGQIVGGLLVSEETTSVLISNVLWHLSRDPQLWTDLRKDVAAQGNNLQTYEELLDFKPIKNILLESLRLHPALPLVSRVALEDTTLPAGGGPEGKDPIFMPQFSAAYMSTYDLHRDPAVFGENPAEFRPARWNEISPSQWEFMGFGGGARSCLGQTKAMLEAAYVLVRCTRALETIEGVGGDEWKGKLSITWSNPDGCLVKVTKAGGKV